MLVEPKTASVFHPPRQGCVSCVPSRHTGGHILIHQSLEPSTASLLHPPRQGCVRCVLPCHTVGSIT
eukprot:39261-Chlamydomonas_euryale.AAC.2